MEKYRKLCRVRWAQRRDLQEHSCHYVRTAMIRDGDAETEVVERQGLVVCFRTASALLELVPEKNMAIDNQYSRPGQRRLY